MADHELTEKSRHQTLCNEVNILDSEEYWRDRRVKEPAHMFDYKGLTSGPSIEINGSR